LRTAAFAAAARADPVNELPWGQQHNGYTSATVSQFKPNPGYFQRIFMGRHQQRACVDAGASCTGGELSEARAAATAAQVVLPNPLFEGGGSDPNKGDPKERVEGELEKRSSTDMWKWTSRYVTLIGHWLRYYAAQEKEGERGAAAVPDAVKEGEVAKVRVPCRPCSLCM
jgi:hypothetical protein